MGIKRMISFGISFMMILSTLSLCPVKAEELSSEGLNNNAPSKQEIIDYLSSHNIDCDPSVSYDKDFTKRGEKDKYDVSDAGKLSSTTKEQALAYLNAMRYIAGVDKVTSDDDINEKAQCSAYVNYLNDAMDHRPSKPKGASDALFEKGYWGSSHGNLDCMLATYNIGLYYGLDSSIDDWVGDSDGFNIPNVGHRRWCLDPQLTSAGFGRAYGEVSGGQYDYVSYSTMSYTYDNDKKASQTGISWPAQNMPIDYFSSNNAWSYLSTKALDDDHVCVDLTLKKSQLQTPGKTWHITKDDSSDGDLYTSFYLDEGKVVGHTDAVIFVPYNITIRSGDVYNVKITGINQTVNYDIAFFALHHVNSIQLKEGTLNDQGELVLPDQGSYDLTQDIKLDPENALKYDLAYESDNEDVVSCDRGTLKPHKIGSALITVKSSNGVTLNVPVKIISHIVKVPEGKTLTYNGEMQKGIDLPEGVSFPSGWGTKEAKDAGEYWYSVKLKDGFTWDDGSSGSKEIDWSIVPCDNEIESFTVNNVTYPNKPAVNVKLKYNDDDKIIEYKKAYQSDYFYTTTPPTNTGYYKVRVTYYGNRNINEISQTKDFAIYPKKVDVPLLTTQFTYDGQSHNVCDSTDEIDVTGASSQPGTHTATLDLKGSNYIWSDNTRSPKSVTYTITAPDDKNSSSDQDHSNNGNTAESGKDDSKNASSKDQNTTNNGNTTESGKDDSKNESSKDQDTLDNGNTSEADKDDSKNASSKDQDTSDNGNTSESGKDDSKNKSSKDQDTSDNGNTCESGKDDSKNKSSKDHDITNNGNITGPSKEDSKNVSANNQNTTTEIVKNDDAKNQNTTTMSAPTNNNATASADMKKQGSTKTTAPVKTKISKTTQNGLMAIQKEVIASKKADLAHSTYRVLMLKQGKTTSKSIKLMWKKVKGAKQYMIFGSKVGQKYQYVGTTKKTSFIAKGLKKKMYYKYTLVALGAKDQILTISKAAYVSPSNKVTKVKAVKTLKVKKGKSVKVKAKQIGKVKTYRRLSLESSNNKMIKIKGMKVTGLKKGRTTLYVYAQNGVATKIKLIVK